MDQEEQIYVRYGDYISLHVEHLQGMLASQGFSNRNCILQYNPLTHQDCFTRNKRDFCFQIWPRLQYDARQDYMNALDFFNRQFINAEVEDEIIERAAAEPEEKEEAKKEENGDGQVGEKDEEAKKEENKSNLEPETPLIKDGEDNGSTEKPEKSVQEQGDPEINQEEQLEEEEEEFNVPTQDNYDSYFSKNNQQKSNQKVLSASMKKDRDNYILKLLSLKRKVKDEEYQNLKQFNFKQGEFVEYGNIVQLMHVDSEQFIQGQKTCADEDNSCNKIDLATYGGNQVFFQVLGGFKYKKEGDRIHYNDQVLFKNVSANSFLHVTERLLSIQGLEGEFPPHLQEGVQKITPRKYDRRKAPYFYAPYFEVNMSNIKTKFQIQVFRYFNEDFDSQYIKGGTIFRLLHSEKEGFLHSDDVDFTGDGTSEVYLWNYKGKKTDNEAQSSHSLFEIESAAKIVPKNANSNVKEDTLGVKRQDPEKRFGQVFHFSQLTNSNSNDGNKSKGDQHEFRFRHLNTGRLIVDQEIDYNGFKIKTLGLAPHLVLKDLAKFSEKHVDTVLYDLQELDSSSSNFVCEETTVSKLSNLSYEELDRRSRFRIISTSPNVDTRIKSNSCVQIQHVASEMFISYSSRITFTEPVQNEMVDDLLNDPDGLLKLPELKEQSSPLRNTMISGPDIASGEVYFQPVDKDDIQSGARDAVELTASRSNEDAFFVIPEQKSVMNSILFIQTAIDLLNKYLPTICSKNIEISKEKQNKINDVINKIYDFLDDNEDGENLRTNEYNLEINFSKDKNDEIQKKRSNLKLRQKLMRELYIVESLVQMIYLPFSYGEHKLKQLVQTDVITQVSQHAYRLIKRIGQNYYQNELYVSQWINLYFKHAMNTNQINNIGAEDTIISLVDNNKRLLEMQITPAIIESIVNLCVEQNRDAQLIQLLKAICSCNGEPIPNNQKDIVKILLGNPQFRSFLMTPIRLVSNPNDQELSTIELCVGKENGRETWLPINQYTKLKKQTYYYFLNVIELSAELCLGRNGLALDNLQEMFSFESIKLVIKERVLPFEMRALFMRMLNIMHMDREPLEPVQIPSQTGVWDDLLPFEKENFLDPNNIQYAIKQSKIQVPKALNSIKKFVETYLWETHGVQKMYETGKNMMTLEILKIIKFMLNHGFYLNLKELKQIAASMILMLNGANDEYFENDEEAKNDFVSSKRYFSSGNNDIIVQSKTLICENLLIISKIEIDGKTMVFLAKFKGDLDRMMLQQQMNRANPDAFNKKENQPVQSQKAGKTSFFQTIKMSLGKVAIEKPPIMSFKQVENENIEFLQEIAMSYNFEADNQESYICVLFDLLLYKYSSLASCVFELLVKLFTRKRILLENLQKIQMLENPRSIRVLNQVQKFYYEIKSAIEDADIWLNQSNTLAKRQKKKITQIFMFFSQLCSESSYIADEDDDDQSAEKKELQIDFSRADSVNSQSLLRTQTNVGKQKTANVSQKDFILFHNEDKYNRVNYENQRLLGTMSVENLALYFIKYRTDKSQINDPYYQQLITSCYTFLVNYVRNNLQNQIKVHNNLDIFLREIEKNPLICLLIYELFKNNKQFLTLNVTKILRTIIISAEESSLQSSKKALYLKLLEVFCKFEDKLVRPNQQEIVVSFTRDISKNNLIFLFSQEGINHLIKLLQACIPGQYKDKLQQKNELDDLVNELEDNRNNFVTGKSITLSMEVFNVLQCINLMSLCCEGKNDLSELKCQTEIINIHIALTLYRNSGRLWPFKQCLLDYICNCYMDSSNKNLFIEGFSPSSLANRKSLKELVTLISQDIIFIYEDWHNTEGDFKIIMPDMSTTSFQKESKKFAMQQVCLFFLFFVKNKSIDLGVEMFPVYHEITTKLAKLYYETQNKAFKNNAMDVLSAVNNSEKYSCLLENVQHPANQNIYIEGQQKLQKKPDFQVRKGQKSNSLNAKLIQLSYSPDMIEQKEREFEDLVLWVTNIDVRINFIMEHQAIISGDRDSFVPGSFDHVSYSPIVCSFMNLLDSKCLNKDLHIAGLTLLRKIVEVENREMVTPSSDWDGSDWEKYKKIIKAKQDSLVDIGCVEFLCKHIQEIDDDQILEQAFQVCITLLLGGNKKTQESFFNFFITQDPNNLVMQKLKAMLVEQFSQTKKVIGERNAKLAMIYKNKQRKQAQKELKLKEIAQAKSENKVKALNKGGIMNFSTKLIGGIGGKLGLDNPNNVDHLDEEEKEGNDLDDDDNLLTLEESGDEQIKQGDQETEKIDDMFLVNQIKEQYIIRTMRLLRFLQLLTEGHHSDLQNFLREQKHANGLVNQKSFDFISYVAQMLAIFEKQYINCYTCSFGMQLIETLIEMVQGPCLLNQKRLVEAKIIDCCRDLIQQGQQTKYELELRGFTTEAKLEYHDQLKMTAIKLLLSIIEGTVDVDIYRQIADSLDDFVILTDRMESIYEKFVREDLNISVNSTQQQVNAALSKDSFTGNITEGFNIYCLINQLAMALPDVKEKITRFSETNIFQFFMRNTGNVEVHKDNEVITVYFPIHPVSHFLTKSTIERFNLTVNRESNTHKILDLISRCPQFIDEMEHLELRSHDFINITPERLGFLRDFSTLIAVMISFICIFFYKYDYVNQPDGSRDLAPVINEGPQIIMNNLGYLQLATASLLLIGFCVNKINIILKSGWRKKTSANKILLADDIKLVLQPLTPTFGELRVQDLPLKAARVLMLTEGPEHPAFYDSNGKQNFYYLALYFEYKWICLSYLMQDSDFIFSVAYLAFSLQGLIQSPLFYSCHLADVVNRFPQLKNVIASVTLNGKSLLMTGMLGLIIVYIFSAFGYVFINDMYFDININAGYQNRVGDSICQTMLHCFLSTINYGIRGSGGVGDVLPDQTAAPFNVQGFYFRQIFDLGFFIIIITVLLNIIFGIIIDTFAQLREQKANTEDDRNNVCFICNYDRQTFDRETDEGFDVHIQYDHNVWQYVNFIIHLLSIDVTELNGTESYILELFRKEDIQWLPMQKSQRLIMVQQQRNAQKQAHLINNEGAEGEEGQEGGVRGHVDILNDIPQGLEDIETKVREIEVKYK